MLSAPSLAHCPPDTGLEIAFSGRSNVGKSSVINALTGISRIARTSKTPGRTQMLNFIALDDGFRLVDLPGYGYAQVPESMKRRWASLLQRYLTRRRSLCGLALVVDIRRPLQDSDWHVIGAAQARSLPVYAMLNKADKLSKSQAGQALLSARAALEPHGPMVHCALFSAKRLQGVGELRGWTQAQRALDAIESVGAGIALSADMPGSTPCSAGQSEVDASGARKPSTGPRHVRTRATRPGNNPTGHRS